DRRAQAQATGGRSCGGLWFGGEVAPALERRAPVSLHALNERLIQPVEVLAVPLLPTHIGLEPGPRRLEAWQPQVGVHRLEHRHRLALQLLEADLDQVL